MNHRVMFLTPALGKGGAETQLIKVARFLKHQNIDVLIVSLKQINDFPASLKEEGIEVVFLRTNWLYSFIPNLYSLLKVVRNFKPDVVISFMFIAIIVGRLLKQQFNFKLISSIRASRIDRKWSAIFKLTSGLDDSVVYNSNASKEIFEGNGMAGRKGIVIRNAITVPNFPTILSNSTFKWISIAHFRVDKDYPTLFKAISLLKEINFKVDILGHVYNLDWPLRSIIELGIQDHVNLLGFKANTSDYLKRSDASILSSFSEGMPNAVLESMAYSKPVVASDIDCIAEIFGASNGGLLFKTGDAEDLASKMLVIMQMGEEERREMGRSGRDIIDRTFEENIVFNQWLTLINSYLPQESNMVNP